MVRSNLYSRHASRYPSSHSSSESDGRSRPEPMPGTHTISWRETHRHRHSRSALRLPPFNWNVPDRYVELYICHRHEIWVKEKMTSFGGSYSNWEFQWQCWHMGRWSMVFPLHMHSGLPTEKVEQMIMTSLDDITLITCAIWGEKYIRRAHSGFRAVIWVSGTEWLGLLLSHWPSTLAILVPLVEQEYIQDELSSLFIHGHAPRLFGNALVSMT